MALGTLRSWMRDGLLAGTLLPPSVLMAMLIALKVVEGERFPRDLLFGLSVSSGIGTALMLGITPVAWWAARQAWRVPLLAFSLGPVGGAIATWAATWLFVLLIEGHSLKLTPWEHLAVLGFGAFALGPPWVAYLAVRARGRPGLPAVLAALVWASGGTAAAILLFLLRWRWTRGW